jgi:hypothetical protein
VYFFIFGCLFLFDSVNIQQKNESTTCGQKKIQINVNTTVNNRQRQILTLCFTGFNFTTVALAPRCGASETPMDKIKKIRIKEKK